MPFPSEHAARLKDPGLFDPKSFRRVNGKFGAGIDVIFGKLKSGSGAMVIQTIRFDAAKFTPEQVRTWLKDHKYNASVEAASGEANKEITFKHLPGQHSQKRHGYRIGAEGKTGPKEQRGKPTNAPKSAVRDREQAGGVLSTSRASSDPGTLSTSRASSASAKSPDDKLSAIPKLTSAQLAKPGVKKALQEAQASKRRIDKLQAELDAKIKRLADLRASKKELTVSIAIATASPFFYHQQPGELIVTTTKDGRDRWTLFSSSGFRDRDREIVSTKALLADVERADKDHDYGPLRFWHLIVKDRHGRQRGVDLGDCDFNMVRGHILIESGTFRSPAIAKSVKEHADQLEVSIGFVHPATDPDSDGVYHRIRRFERSLVPKGRVANRTTRLII